MEIKELQERVDAWIREYGNDKLTSQLAGFFISFGSDIILIKNNL